MEFETVERCGRIYVVKNGVESECFAITSYGDHRLIYCPALQAQMASPREALEFIAKGMDNWYTVAQAAARLVELGAYDSPPSAHTMANLARAGAFPGAFKLRGRGSGEAGKGGGQGGAWRIPEAGLQTLVERRGR